MARIEDISPDSIGKVMIELTLEDPDAPVRAHQPCALKLNYKRADALGGVVLPIDIIVSSGSSSSSYRRVTYRRIVPATFTWTPVEGGPHLVVVRERFHNRWYGWIKLDVDGERLAPNTL